MEKSELMLKKETLVQKIRNAGLAFNEGILENTSVKYDILKDCTPIYGGTGCSNWLDN